MNTTFRNLTTLFTAAALVLLLTAAATACPTCKDSVAGDPRAAGMVQGYMWSILFMMSMPFLILCGLGGYFYLQVLRARRESPEPQPLPKPQPLPADLTAEWS